MEKKILFVGVGVGQSMINEALFKANLTQNDVVIIQEDSDEAKELLKSNRHQFPELVNKSFELNAHARFDDQVYFHNDYKHLYDKKPKGGKKNKRNWKY